MVVWPAGGRMLSAPLVLGSSLVGDGSLEMVGDTITPNVASFDDSPPELSLRLFTFVPKAGGGFSAVLRFRTPIVQLRSWRGHVVRQTMTVVVRSPSGAAQAVQMQPDGTAMNGSFSTGRFQAVAPGKAAMAGNVVVFDVPASFGASPDWTVQAIVEVQADEPLHRNRPATGYAAGTSIVPIGLLTGEKTKSSSGLGVVDATTALTSPTSTPTAAPGLRPRGVRLEGTGKKLTAVVTLDGSPSKLSGTDHPHVDVDVAVPGFATLDHPVRVTWLPGGAQPATSAQVLIDSVVVGDVPVKVSGNEVRFELGAATARKDVVVPTTARLDEMQYNITLPLGLEESVSSVDGMSGPPLNPDTAAFVVDGPKVTVTPASTGITAKGFVDSTGHFVATSDTEMFTGSVDDIGNVFIYRTTVSPASAIQKTAARSAAGRVHQSPLVLSGTRIPGLPDDWTYDELNQLEHEIILLRHLEVYKYVQRILGPYAKSRPDLPFPYEGLGSPTGEPVPDVFGAHGGGAEEPSGAQAGYPDWPATPALATPNDSTGTSVFRASAATVPQGNPVGVTTPWMGTHGL